MPIKKKHLNQARYFAIVGIIHSSVPYFIWKSLYTGNTHFIMFQFIAGVMCFVALVKEEYFYKDFDMIVWYISLIYVFPFQGGVMFFINSNSSEWLAYFIGSTILLLYFTEAISFIICSIFGVLFAILFCHYAISLDQMLIIERSRGFLYIYLICIIMNISWKYTIEKQRQEKIEVGRKVASHIAHEMRSAMMYFSTLGGVIGNKELYANNMVPNIIKEVLVHTEHIVRSSSTVIEMILVRLKGANYENQFSKFRIKSCIDKAITNLNDTRVEFDLDYKDFIIHAPYELVLHVFFNLLKNSYYFLSETEKPKIIISSSTNENHNIICFIDNGLGMSEEVRKKIFEEFYSKRTGGTGIGLSFCKNVMNDIKGDIDCYSEENKYTKFNLYFPKVEND